MTAWDIEELVARYNNDLLEGEPVMTYEEMLDIMKGGNDGYIRRNNCS